MMLLFLPPTTVAISCFFFEACSPPFSSYPSPDDTALHHSPEITPPTSLTSNPTAFSCGIRDANARVLRRYWTVKMTAMAMVTSSPLADTAEEEATAGEQPAGGYEIPHFGGAEEGNLCSSGCYAIVDTGTSGERDAFSGWETLRFFFFFLEPDINATSSISTHR